MTTPTATAPAESAATEASWPHRLARYLILKVLGELRYGHLLIHEGNSTISVGEADLPPVEIQVLDSGFFDIILAGHSSYGCQVLELGFFISLLFYNALSPFTILVSSWSPLGRLLQSSPTHAAFSGFISVTRGG